MTAPNFLVIGAARSATTALCSQLDQHPNIFITTPKETHFFAHAEQPHTYTGPGDDEMINQHLISNPDTYLNLYQDAGATTARGEGSVSTLYQPHTAPAAITQWADPNVRLVAMLREPAARAQSSYLYLRSRGYEPLESLSEGLDAEEERIANGYHHMWHYSAMSQYASQLPAFAEAFGDRLLTIVFEEYRDAPEQHLAQICEHIGIDPTFEFNFSDTVNQGGEPRSQMIAKSLSSLRSNQRIKDIVKNTTSMAMRERIRQLNLTQPEPPNEVFETLYAKHEPDRQAVYDVLARKVQPWEN